MNIDNYTHTQNSDNINQAFLIRDTLVEQ